MALANQTRYRAQAVRVVTMPSGAPHLKGASGGVEGGRWNGRNSPNRDVHGRDPQCPLHVDIVEKLAN
jgi:hypothetical protein